MQARTHKLLSSQAFHSVQFLTASDGETWHACPADAQKWHYTTLHLMQQCSKLCSLACITWTWLHSSEASLSLLDTTSFLLRLMNNSFQMLTPYIPPKRIGTAETFCVDSSSFEVLNSKMATRVITWPSSSYWWRYNLHVCSFTAPQKIVPCLFRNHFDCRPVRTPAPRNEYHVFNRTTKRALQPTGRRLNPDWWHWQGYEKVTTQAVSCSMA